MRFVLCLALAGCSLCPLGQPPAAPPDAAADLAADCDSLRDLITTWMEEHRTCEVDADCVVIRTGCGLPGALADHFSRDALSLNLFFWLQAWQLCPEAQDCASLSTGVGAPACVDGRCAARREHSAPL